MREYLTSRRIARVPTWSLGSTLVVILTALGCGDGRPDRVPISGVVTIDGQPLAHGSILFKPANGRSAGGALDSQGRYFLTYYEKGDGAVPGEYTVAVSANEQLGETAMRWHAPRKYSNPETSELKATVDEPREDLNFELKWDGGKPFTTRL